MIGTGETSLGIVIQHFVGRAMIDDLAALEDHEIVEKIEDLRCRLMDGAHHSAVLGVSQISKDLA